MTAEVRLVDADELRRRYISEGYARRGEVVRMLDAMPSVAAPKGWTRDEVLAELAKHPDNVCEVQSIYTGEWVALAPELIDQWHPEVRRFDVRVVRSTPDPEWVPVFDAIRDERTATSPGMGDFVVTEVVRASDGKILAMSPSKARYVHVRDDGMVAVRPEAAT